MARKKRLAFKSAPASWLASLAASAQAGACSGSAKSAWWALGADEQRRVKNDAEEAVKSAARAAKQAKKAHKSASTAAPKAAKAASGSGGKKSARADGYHVQFARCPESWKSGEDDREAQWSALSVAEQQAVVSAAKTLTKIRWAPPDSFKAHHNNRDALQLVNMWKDLGTQGRRKWKKDHAGNGKDVSVGVKKKRLCKVPRAFRQAHAGEELSVIRAKWASYSTEDRARFMNDAAKRRAAAVVSQARTVTLPRSIAAAAEAASGSSAVADARITKVKWSAAIKIPALKATHTEATWSALEGGEQHRQLNAAKRDKEERGKVSVAGLWKSARNVVAQRKQRRMLSKNIQKGGWRLRSKCVALRFAKVVVAQKRIAARRWALQQERKSLRTGKTPTPAGDTPQGARTASFHVIFPPPLLCEPRGDSARPGRAPASIMLPAAPVLLQDDMDERKKVLALHHLSRGLDANILAQAGLARVGQPSDLPACVEYDIDQMQTLLSEVSKKRRASRVPFASVSAIANQVPPAGGPAPWGRR